MTQQQPPKVTECSICTKNGINGVKIYLHKVGSQWIPTKANPETNEDLNETHFHFKFCRNNCGVVGYYDPEEKTFIERSSAQRHDCPNYNQPQQQQPEQQSQPQQPQQVQQGLPVAPAKNPIEQLSARAPIPDDASKKIGLIWTLLTEDHKKIEDIHRSYKATEDLMKSFMDSYQKLEASIKTILENPDNLFKKSSEMRLHADSVTTPYPDADQEEGEEPTG